MVTSILVYLVCNILVNSTAIQVLVLPVKYKILVEYKYKRRYLRVQATVISSEWSLILCETLTNLTSIRSNQNTMHDDLFTWDTLKSVECRRLGDIVIDDGSGNLSNQALNWFKAMQDVQLDLIDAGLLECLEQSEKDARSWNFNNSLVAKVKDLQATESIRGPNKQLAEAHQEMDQLEDELRIEKYHSVKLERWQEKCKSELESTYQTDIVQL
ncbi:hypothetical protein K440DRAFT_646557 [Wilcoxina mikolae CBS 423.85]|nr:hypothetical protein K440DRAFT_646557 [Wilcoxina mikolae CBS 423.85]